MGTNAKLPAAQSVTLKCNVSGFTPTLTVTGVLGAAWLTTSIPPGDPVPLPASLTVTVTPTGLSPNIYTATLTLSGIDANGALVSTDILVTLAVIAPASKLDFTPPTGLSFRFNAGDPPTPGKPFFMYSEGSSMTVTVSAGNAAWLKLNPTGSVQVGGYMQRMQVDIDPVQFAKLVPGNYTATVTVSAPSSTIKSYTYPVTLEVDAKPPVVTDAWPAGLVMSSDSTGATTMVISGDNFFSTSKVAATGFTSSNNITVTDTATNATASERILIPVFPAGMIGLYMTLAGPLPTGVVGTAYAGGTGSFDLSTFVTGGTRDGQGNTSYSWSSTNLPPGITLDSSGLLHGNPTTPGVYSMILTVTDMIGGVSAYMPICLTVYPATPPLAIVIDHVLSAATVGIAYSDTVSATGGTAYTWTRDAFTSFNITGGGAAGVTGTIDSAAPATGTTGAITTKLLSSGALQIQVPNSYLAKPGILRMAVTTPAPGGGTSTEAQVEVYGPEPRILGIGNAASYAGGNVAPGELITIFGTGLGPATIGIYDPTFVSTAGLLPTSLPIGGANITQVLFTVGSGANAHTYPGALVYTLAGQIGVMVPFSVTPNAYATVSIVVTYGPAGSPLASQPWVLNVIDAVPGIFSADGSGQGQGAILNAVLDATGTAVDYTVNSASAPALLKGGASVVVLYVTGFGDTSPNPAQNSFTPVPAAPKYDTKAVPTVTIDGKSPQAVATAVPPLGFPGVLQLNVTLPADASAGKAVPVTVDFGTRLGQKGITMALK